MLKNTAHTNGYYFFIESQTRSSETSSDYEPEEKKSKYDIVPLEKKD